jgi:hypothetical protein
MEAPVRNPLVRAVSAAAAMSSAVPIRRAGLVVDRAWNSAAFRSGPRAWYAPVSMVPGAIGAAIRFGQVFLVPPGHDYPASVIADGQDNGARDPASPADDQHGSVLQGRHMFSLAPIMAESLLMDNGEPGTLFKTTASA